MNTVRPITNAELAAVQRAERLLRESLGLLVEADCPRTAERVRRAIKSAGGAVRHAYRRLDAASTNTCADHAKGRAR